MATAGFASRRAKRRAPLHVLVLLCTAPLLSFSNSALPDEDDRDRVAIVLTDVTADTGLAGLAGDRFSFADYDGDGDPDLLVNGKTLLRNDTAEYGKRGAAVRFRDVSAETGIEKGPGGGACWADFDGDGRLDVVTQHGGLKLQVKPGVFADQAQAWGLPAGRKSSTVGVGDFDGDGRPDLLFGGGEDWNQGNAKMYPRFLHRNVDGKRFEDVTCDHDLGTARYGRAVVWADFDRDGDQDVYLGNYRLQPNELLVNEDGALRDRAEARGVQGKHDPQRFLDEKTGQRFGWQWGHTIASSWADLDADGDLDLWVSNLVHKFVGQGTYEGKPWYDPRGYLCDDSAIYRNDGAPGWGFTDVRAQSGIPLKPIGDRGVYRGDELWSNAACGDLDGDGLPEVFVAQVYKLPYSHTLLFRNRGGFRFEEVSETAGVRRFNSYGGAFADLDGDGDLDLVCGGAPEPEGKGAVCVFRNDTPPGPWIAFRLEGAAPGTDALGAQVVVETDQGPMVRQVESCMGSHAQKNESVLRFGLRGRTYRGACVRWPGGLVEEIRKAQPDRVHDVAPPKSLPGFARSGPWKLPGIEVDTPEAVYADEPARFRATCKGRNARRWAWSGDADGDGVFELQPRDGRFEARFEAPRGEFRIRLSHAAGHHIERVVRFPVVERKTDEGD